ncbi:DUF6496 domain-containing protein [Ginsengibacter hankyongi]
MWCTISKQVIAIGLSEARRVG